MEWLLAPIDPSRAHEVGTAVSWHARLMILAWGVLAPVAILMARFFKVLPGQDWPRELDNQAWWRGHWMGLATVVCLSFVGLVLVLRLENWPGLHGVLGYTVLALMIVQVTLGILRGSKGGPTAPAQDGSLHGDHFDMTPRRLLFEALHKSLGYLTLLLALITILLGMWAANALVWMWLCLTIWWFALVALGIVLQSRGKTIDTYQAIWGTDPSLPGNQRLPVGWGVRQIRESGDVRRD